MSRGRRSRMMRARRAVAMTPWTGLECLEPRVLLSTFSWTAEEVYLLELVNRARANPQAEGLRLGIDLTAGLTSGERDRLVPSEPLALNPALTIAARAHSLDMAERDYFDHNTPEGLTPTDRARAQGYLGSAGENIAAGYQTVDDAHRAWIESVGHRKNIFSLHTNFDSTFHYDEFGPGFAFTDIGPYFDFYTELFGVPPASQTGKYILGVVYDDANGNDFYNIGEGLGNVRVDVTPLGDLFTVVASYITDAAGNYQMRVPAGQYHVVFTNLATNLSYVTQVTVGQYNVKADAKLAQLTTNLDDHADAGDFDAATPITLKSDTGDGAAAGIIEHPADTDLFRFTAAGTGEAVISVTTAQGSLVPGMVVFGPSRTPLGVGVLTGGGTEATFSINVVQGQTYYVLVESSGGETSGPYALTVLVPVGGGDPDVPVNPYAAGPGAVPDGAATSDGLLTLTVANRDGRPIVYVQQADGSWTVTDLISTAGGPQIEGDPMTWTDPKDGRPYIAARSAQGLVLYRREPGGVWSLRNLGAEIAGAPIITGESTSFITIDGIAAVAGLAANGDMILYHQTGENSGGHFLWTAVNLSERDLRPQGLSTPAFAGKLISYVTAWNAQNITGLDAQGNILTVWWAPGLSAWSVDNLTAKTGAPPIVGGLTAYLTSWSGIHLAGVNDRGELTVTWWVPLFGPNWASNNLTREINGPAVRPDSIASYVTAWGGLNVVAADEDGRLVVYWWAPELKNILGEDRWLVTTLSDEVPDGPVPDGPLTGVTFGDTISVVGADEDGDLFRYWWQVGGAWQAQNLTDIAVPV